MEAEARQILQSALAKTPTAGGPTLAERIQQRFAALGGVELELEPREPPRDPPTFD